MIERHGWLLDIYADGEDGLVVWLLAEDGARLRLRHDFPITFYAAGDFSRLRQLWRWLRRCPTPPALARARRRDLFAGEIDVLAITVSNPARLGRLFAAVRRRFPDLDYYDADVHVALRYTAVTHTYPLAFCTVTAADNGRIHTITPLSSPWEIVIEPPPLRVLTLFPDVNPHHAQPRQLQVGEPDHAWLLPLHPRRLLLMQLQATLRRTDPDVIVTRWGDTWLFPLLLKAAAADDAPPFNPNRDDRPVLRRQANSFFTYGQVVYRGPQVHLYGRYHIDQHNAVIAEGDGAYGLTGVLEQARTTGLPVQEVARKSPGAGITALQMVTALRQGILVPYQKQQSERFKSAADLLRSDRGGMVYQPRTGLHRRVVEVDFVSMYPAIMVHFNISPETVGVNGPKSAHVPELGLAIDQAQDGLVPQTLRPLLAKRIAIKQMLAAMSCHDYRRQRLAAQSAALKWLLVVCFGYLGYKNARFGRIEAHEAVTAYGREALLRAKETAESLGYRVLHMYVDGLWLQPGTDILPETDSLLAAITVATGLPIALEGIYNWIAFLPSRLDPRVPVPNRYFGAFVDGSLKVRGLATRRRDTPPWVAQVQTAVLQTLARVPADQPLTAALPTVLTLVRQQLHRLRHGRISAADLLVTQRLSREPTAYKSLSPAALAATQLAAAGKPRRPGQKIQFLYTMGNPGVHAWDLAAAPPPLDNGRYQTLLLRAIDDVLMPLDVNRRQVQNYLRSGSYQLPLPLSLPGTPHNT